MKAHVYTPDGDGKPKVVVAVDANRYTIDVSHLGSDPANQCAVLLRHRVTGRVGNIHHRGARIDDRFQHLEQVRRIGAPCVFGVELHVIDECFREPHCIHSHLQDGDLLLAERAPVSLIAELPHHVDVRCADPSVDARPFGFG